MSIFNTISKIINIIKSILITFTPIGTIYNYKKDYDKPFNFIRSLYRFIGFLFGLFAIYLSSVCNENINYEIIFALLFAPIYVGYKLFTDPTLCNILPPIFKFLGIDLLQENMKDISKIPKKQKVQKVQKVIVKETNKKLIEPTLPTKSNQNRINVNTNPAALSLNTSNTVKLKTKSPVRLTTKSPVRLTTKSPVRLTTKSPTSFSLPLTTSFPKPYSKY